MFCWFSVSVEAHSNIVLVHCSGIGTVAAVAALAATLFRP